MFPKIINFLFWLLFWCDHKDQGLGRYGGDFCRVSLALRDDKNLLDDVTKLGFMTASQYKRLCIFVVSRSLRDDLLDTGIGP